MKKCIWTEEARDTPRSTSWWGWGFVAPSSSGAPTWGDRGSSQPPDGLAKPTPHTRTLSPCSSTRVPTWTASCAGWTAGFQSPPLPWAPAVSGHKPLTEIRAHGRRQTHSTAGASSARPRQASLQWRPPRNATRTPARGQQRSERPLGTGHRGADLLAGEQGRSWRAAAAGGLVWDPVEPPVLWPRVPRGASWPRRPRPGLRRSWPRGWVPCGLPLPAPAPSCVGPPGGQGVCRVGVSGAAGASRQPPQWLWLSKAEPSRCERRFQCSVGCGVA